MDPTTPIAWLKREVTAAGWGPGLRALIWLPDDPSAEGVERTTAGELAEWAGMQANVEGLTLAGGEPLAQSRGIVNLIQAVKANQPRLTIICHTGLDLDRLQSEPHAWRRVLLELVDVLVHGGGIGPRDPYWGSLSGQQIACFTTRYKDLQPD